jgi:hypothetical protein
VTLVTMIIAALLAFQSAKGSIDGVVSNAANKPIAGAQVTLMKLPGGSGGLTGGVLVGQVGPITRETATTDAAGHFVFSDLEAGNYSVQAAADGYARQQSTPPPAGQTGMSTTVSVSAGEAKTGVVLHLTQAGNVSGRVTGSNGEPVANMEVTLVHPNYSVLGVNMGQMGSAQTNDKGEYRLFWAPPGRYYVSVGSPTRPVLLNATTGTTAKYPQTFYPGTKDISAAAQIEIVPGGDLNGIDFRLTAEPTFHVRGRIVDATSGQPPVNASISIVPKSQTAGGLFSSSNPFNPKDGTFDLRDVLAGSYWVRAQLVMPRPATGGVGGSPLRQPMGLAEVDVSGRDVDNVVVTIYPPASIPGHIRIDGPSPAAQLTTRVSLQPATLGVFLGGIPQAATVNPDGSFLIENVLPGEYRLAQPGFAPAVASGNTYLKQARLGATDLLTEPLVVSGPVSGELLIVMGTDGGTVTGTVTDAQGRQAPQTQIILIPSSLDRRDAYKLSMTDASGHFTLRGVAPGSYKVFAVDQQTMQTFFDPSVMQRLQSNGMPVTVGSTATVNADLKVISLR